MPLGTDLVAWPCLLISNSETSKLPRADTVICLLLPGVLGDIRYAHTVLQNCLMKFVVRVWRAKVDWHIIYCTTHRTGQLLHIDCTISKNWHYISKGPIKEKPLAFPATAQPLHIEQWSTVAVFYNKNQTFLDEICNYVENLWSYSLILLCAHS